MSRIDAPEDYVRWYYATDRGRWRDFPEVTAFKDAFLSEVRGETVLNAGCGPQYYDWLRKFGETPKRYVGVDVSAATIAYLEHSTDPEISAARQAAQATGATLELACADIFDWPGLSAERFDCVVATGFIGTFHDPHLSRLMARLRDALKPGGRLVKMTWHGPHRTPEQTAKKLEYGYDSLDEHDPDTFLETLLAAGFETERAELFRCDPETYRWDWIQGCVLRKR